MQNKYIGVYVQDEYKVSDALSLSYGLRWEDFTPIGSPDNTISSFDSSGAGLPFRAGLGGYSAQPYSSYNSAFGPRIGFSYQPFHSSKTVLRGGFGITYNAATVGNGFQFVLSAPPVHQINVYVGPGHSSPNPFVGTGTPSLTPGRVARGFRPAQIDTFSLGMQQQLSRSTVLELTYLGATGHHLFNQINLNQPLPSTGTAAQVQASRPYPTYGNISWVESEGVSNYHSLQVKLQRNYTHGFTILIADTYGKSLDDTGGVSTTQPASPAYPQDSRNIAYTMYGRSDFDVRNRLVVSPVYELPLGRGKALLSNGVGSAILGGFQVSSIITSQTGTPFRAGLSNSLGGSNTGNSTIASGIDRPNLVPGVDPNAGPKSHTQWFNPAAFALPNPGTFGNAGRNILKGPGFTNVDLTMARVFLLPREKSVQARFETFNVFNHPNFGLPSANLALTAGGVGQLSPTFGPINSAMANDNRDFQLALKFAF